MGSPKDEYEVAPLGAPEGTSLNQTVDDEGYGHAFLKLNDNNIDLSRPSLSGGYSGPGAPKALGIGGTEVGAENRPEPSFAPPQRQAERALTPEELMAQANAMEQHYLEQTRQVEQEGPSGSHVSKLYAATPQEQKANGGKFDPNGPPEWLTQYMESQPFTDPYHQVPMSGVDRIQSNKYLSEREKLRYMKSLNASR